MALLPLKMTSYKLKNHSITHFEWSNFRKFIDRLDTEITAKLIYKMHKSLKSVSMNYSKLWKIPRIVITQRTEFRR